MCPRQPSRLVLPRERDGCRGIRPAGWVSDAASTGLSGVPDTLATSLLFSWFLVEWSGAEGAAHGSFVT